MTKLIVANWKMNGTASWINIPSEVLISLSKEARKNIEIIFCPPAYLLYPLTQLYRTKGISFGAQDCHEDSYGAFTGELSANGLNSVGANYVILGHSERREMGENNAVIKKKSITAEKNKLTSIICVGESMSDKINGLTSKVILQQIRECVPETLSNIIIAYEPIWSIGSGKIPDISEISEAHQIIKNELGERTRVIYGGSVNELNAPSILSEGTIDGLLVGGASLCVKRFSKICHAATAMRDSF